MPIGHSSFERLRRRRLRPSNIAWGLMVAGAGVLSSSAAAAQPYDVAALAVLCLVTGLVAWRGGRRLGVAGGALAGLAYLGLELVRGQFVLAEAMRAAPAAVGLVGLAVALAELGHLIDALSQNSTLDQATRLPNYDLFMQFLQMEQSRSARYRLPFSLVLLEMEDLDSYSRAFGYWRTDSLLRELAKIMSQTLRRSDLLARLGGPQFALLLPMTNAEGALIAVQRLERAVGVLPLPTQRGIKPRPIGWRAAIAEFPEDGQEAAELLKIAADRLAATPPQAAESRRSADAAPIPLRQRATRPPLPRPGRDKTERPD